MESLRKQEIFFYGAAWLLVFVIATLLTLFGSRHGAETFQLRDIPVIWLQILPFFLLFWIHDLLLAPQLMRRRLAVYLVGTVLLLTLFSIFIYSTALADAPPRMMPPGPPDAGLPEAARPASPPDNMPLKPEIIKVLVAFLVVGVNLGGRFYFKGLRSERSIEELRAENLAGRLESLRHQINPHFFMNTLNNIKALVYLDPAKAGESIDEFSKLMRIVLYDSEKPTYPLATEMAFLNHYVSLMRLRYPESVHIETHFPEDCEGAEIPPLVLATFVENAFKHGVDYEGSSSVLVSVERTDGKIVFRCENSLLPEQKPSVGGKGLENARRRLNLLYGESHLLQAEVRSGRYCILLVIPQTVKTPAL